MNLDVRILSALRGAGAGTISGAELSQQSGVSRAAIWARIEDLRRLGYEIEASPHLGYRLLSSPDLLHADDLVARLGPTRVIGRDVQVFQETTSTNDIVEKLARDGVAEGALVFAETQSRGRGRLGRKWASPGGKGLWFSVLLRPKLRPLEVTRVTVASATALRRAIASETGLKVDIKWPNDILIKGRKVAGILTELHAEVDRVKYVILGIGVDVSLTESDFPPEARSGTTSLALETGRSVSRPELAVAILRELDNDYARITDESFPQLADEWEEQCETIGRRITVRTGQREIHGQAESLGEEGALLLRTQYGHIERIVGGDVTVEKN